MSDTIFQTISLGELIRQLERLPAETILHFDFSYLRPGEFYSYRGYYDHLAMDFIDDAHDTKAGPFLALCRKQIDSQHHGYKGGLFRMGPTTPVWVDKHDRASGTAIQRIAYDGGGYAVIETKHVE